MLAVSPSKGSMGIYARSLLQRFRMIYNNDNMNVDDNDNDHDINNNNSNSYTYNDSTNKFVSPGKLYERHNMQNCSLYKGPFNHTPALQE